MFLNRDAKRRCREELHLRTAEGYGLPTMEISEGKGYCANMIPAISAHVWKLQIFVIIAQSGRMGYSNLQKADNHFRQFTNSDCHYLFMYWRLNAAKVDGKIDHRLG